ncbi:MAG: helix-turn-helix transcriptional regulator [Dehalococcoidia bacterium]|nr:helix-turn-helix transcriptional regulator [Dehalococcoidia bacterium]
MTNDIPHDEPVFQISVVARMVGLHQQTIRSYERIGLVQPARSGGNTRLFSFQDVERLRQVVRLVNDLGVNLAGVEVILRLSNRVEELQAELARCRAELEATRASVARTQARQGHNDNNPDGPRDVQRGAWFGGGNDR